MTSFKNYNIIDYDHKFTIDGTWYMKNLGTPLKIWQNKEQTTYTDVFDVQRTVPEGTWWLQSMITDKDAITEIDNRTLNSYSLTTANKEFADKIMQKYNPISTKSMTVDEMESLKREHNISLKHRTLIKDIKNPVGFTVSLTGFPCVGGAVFAKKCLETSTTSNKNGEDDIMAEGINLSFDNLKELLSLKNNKEGAKEEYVTKEELQETLQANKEELIGEIGKVIDDKIPTPTDPKEGEGKGEGEGAGKEGDGKEGNPKGTSGKEGTGKGEGEGEGADQTSNKHEPGSKQIDHKDDGEGQSFKRGTPEYNLLKELGRDAKGNTKIRL